MLPAALGNALAAAAVAHYAYITFWGYVGASQWGAWGGGGRSGVGCLVRQGRDAVRCGSVGGTWGAVPTSLSLAVLTAATIRLI